MGTMFKPLWSAMLWLAAASAHAAVAPSVSMTSLATNSVFAAPASIVLQATAADSDGTVTKVEFYRGTIRLGTDTT